MKAESDKKKDEVQVRAKAVAQGQVSSKKAVARKNFVESFFTEDVGTLRDYLVNDILIPGIKNTILNMLSISFFGQSRANFNNGGGHTSYNRMYNGGNQNNARMAQPRNIYEYNDIYFNSRQEAQKVLDEMQTIIDQYGDVSVGDYYDACRVSGNGFTDRYYGWLDIRNAYIEPTRNGYHILMPKLQDLR